MSERSNDRVASAPDRARVCAPVLQAQLERNEESTARQYALVQRAIELGFAREQLVVQALLHGIAVFGRCGRKLKVQYQGSPRQSEPGLITAL